VKTTKPDHPIESNTDTSPGVDGASNLVSPERVKRAPATLFGAQRIAVLTKFRFMGDTVVATPFIGQLRSHFPAATIDLLAAPTVVDALANCPHLDRIIPVDIRGVSRWQHGKDLFNLLKQGNYDVAFVLNRSLHCAVTAALSRIPARVGYANELRRYLLTVPIPYGFDRHEVDCHLDMLRSIGLSTEHALPDLWITVEEMDHARVVLARQGVERGKPIIGVQPGANDPYIREWGAERYAAVAEQLASEMNASVVLIGGKAERETADRMAAAMKSPPINLVGEQELRSALSTIGLCSLWLGNDTGLLHCAVAQRVASVGIFGPNKVNRWGYDSPRHRSLVSFPTIQASDDNAVRRCIDAISIEEVAEAARSVVNALEVDRPDTVSTQEIAVRTPKRAPYFAAKLSTASAATVRRR